MSRSGSLGAMPAGAVRRRRRALGSDATDTGGLSFPEAAAGTGGATMRAAGDFTAAGFPGAADVARADFGFATAFAFGAAFCLVDAFLTGAGLRRFARADFIGPGPPREKPARVFQGLRPHGRARSSALLPLAPTCSTRGEQKES